MREATGHFAPGGRALRLHDGRNVVEHDDEPRLRAERHGRDAQEKRHVARRALEFKLKREGFVRAAFVAFAAERGGERRFSLPQLRTDGAAAVAEHAVGGVVARHERKVGVKDDHARGNRGEDALEVGLRLLGRPSLPFERLMGFGELPDHRVEGLRERVDFVAPVKLPDRLEDALGHAARAARELRERLGRALCKRDGRDDGAEGGEKQRDREGRAVNRAQRIAGKEKFLIVAVARKQFGRVFGDGRFDRSDELQVERFRAGVSQKSAAERVREVAVVRDRHDDADREGGVGILFARLEDVAVHCRVDAGILGGLNLQVSGHARKNEVELRARSGRDGGEIARQNEGVGALKMFDLLQKFSHQKRLRDVAQGLGDPSGFFLRVGLLSRQNASGDGDAALERALDAHVEPRFDASRNEGA